MFVKSIALPAFHFLLFHSLLISRFSPALLLLLPLALGMDGVLWAGPISDGVAAVLVLVLGAREVRRLTVQQEETP